MAQDKILVIGSLGQVGRELVETLRTVYGADNVVASDVKDEPLEGGPFEVLDVMKADAVGAVVKKHQITEVYLLAALLSATAEKHIRFAWDLNMDGLFNVLELAKEGVIKKVYWPSSIAVFGPSTPKVNTPQFTVMEPNTVYGISKLAGERWCEYYHQKFGVDVRSLRYPGLIGYKSLPGGGTTDYAVDIYHEALKNGSYTCFLEPGATLPMMYMEDAIRATIEIMQADAASIKVRSSYNLAGISFDPQTIAATIKNHIPEFAMSYAPDSRQAIAASWPQSIDDSRAQEDWGWKVKYDLEAMTADMLKHLK